MRRVFGTTIAAIGLAGVLVVAGHGLASAADGPNVSTDAAAKATAITKLYAMSRDLVDYARANNDPLAMIVAAQIRQQVSLKQVDRKPVTEGASGAAEADATPELTVEGILSEAKTMSNNDDMIAGLAGDVLASASKGRSSGPGYNVQTLPARATDSYDLVKFNGGDYAEVYAEGSGRTNLDLYVYDENGNLVCSDADSSDVAYCGWTPRWTGAFTIKVINRGGASNRYALITN